MSVNPRYYKGPIPTKEKVAVAASKTWQAGGFARSTDSGWTPVLSNGGSINGFFAETNGTSSVAGAKHYVHRIVSPETLFIGCVTSGGTDTKAGSAVIGSNYGIAVNSCIATVSIGNDSTEILHVQELLANKEGIFSDTSDVPGKVIFGVTAAALTAEGVGM